MRIQIYKILGLISSRASLLYQLSLLPKHTIHLPDETTVEMESVIPFHMMKSDPYGPPANDVKDMKHALDCLVISKKIENVKMDLTKLDGFSCSKSFGDGKEHYTLEEFVEYRCPSYIEDISKKNLITMLEHDNKVWQPTYNPGLSIKVGNFQIYGWHPKIYLFNSGGSHHLSAAQYIARRINEDVLLNGRLYLTYFDESAVQRFLQTYEAFITYPLHFNEVEKHLDFAGIEFTRIDIIYPWFKKYRVIETDEDLYGAQLMIFRKQKKHATLIKLMLQKCTSFNELLSKYVTEQNRNKVFLSAM